MQLSRRLAWCAATLVLVSGCGTASEPAGPEPEGTGAPSSDTGTAPQAPDTVLFGECRADDPSLSAAAPLASADLDGNGTVEQVRYVEPGTGPCSSSLVTTLTGATSAVALPEGGLATLDKVQLVGSRRQLVLVRGEQLPTGASSLTLFGVEGSTLGAIEADGRPVLGTAAADGGAGFGTSRCTDDGGIEVLRVSTSKLRGIVAAWDVTRLVYALEGNRAVQVSSEVVVHDGADPVLRQQRPELFDPASQLANCVDTSGPIR